MEVISFEETRNLVNPVFIDLRTPGEFSGGGIPGAINIPLFSDEERGRLGWEYKNLSPARARETGLRMVAPKLPEIIEKINLVGKNQPVVLYCWRGGLRSQAIQQVSELLNIETYRLKGGYREFRRFVLDFLENYELSSPLVTLHGMTGAGKTLILKNLADKKLPVLDLEKMAGHRGSVFGHLGIKNKVGQKIFDGLLWKELDQLGDFPFLVIEGESKRLGNVYLPDFLLGKNREEGVNILIDTPLEKRARYIREEYSSGLKEKELWVQARKCLQNIEKRVKEKAGKKVFLRLEKALAEKDIYTFILVLLRDYYDPLYSGYLRKFPRFDLEISGEDLEFASEEVNRFLKNRFLV